LQLTGEISLKLDFNSSLLLEYGRRLTIIDLSVTGQLNGDIFFFLITKNKNINMQKYLKLKPFIL